MFSERITHDSFGFEFCDTLANFAKSAVDVSDDEEILTAAVAGLVGLGPNHNRWHVRSVLLSILQNVRTVGPAMAALEGLRSGRTDG